LVSIASNDDAYEDSLFSELTQFVVGNQVYYFSVDGYGGLSGNIVLTYSFMEKSPPQQYSLKVNASEGGFVTPPSALYPTNSTVVLTAFPYVDYSFSRWEGSINSTNNPLTVDMIGDRNLTAWFTFNNFTESFESGGFNPALSWSTPAGTPWVVQTNKASLSTWAARSGAIGNSQTSTLRLVVTSQAGSGHFDYFVSTENGWDFFDFRLNGIVVKQWSGIDQQGWKTFSFSVPAGTNTLEWTYTKDTQNSDGLDAVFIDSIYLPMGRLAATVSANVLSENQVQIEVQGKYNQRYVIESSSDLTSWLPVYTNQSPNGVIDFKVPATQAGDKKFYRATTKGN
jgi:hypothetical protein